jgi:Flp pilus assembly protein TadD
MPFAVMPVSPALLEQELPRAERRPAMRSGTLQNATLLGLLASGALVAGCAGDRGVDATTPPLVADGGSAATNLPVEPPVTATMPVDVQTAKAAWKDGVAQFENGEFASASERLKVAVAGEPGNAYRRYLLGLSLWKSGDRDGAEASLVESVKLDATRVKPWINLARVRNERGDRNGALEATDTALALDPDSADALHQKGRALMELGRSDDALTALTAARGKDGGNGYIANTLGLLLVQLGRPAEAIEPLETAKSILPHVAYVRNNLGVAYERTGRMDEAKIEYLAAVDAGDAGGKAMKSLVRLGATDTTQPAEETVVETAAKTPQ